MKGVKCQVGKGAKLDRFLRDAITLAASGHGQM